MIEINELNALVKEIGSGKCIVKVSTSGCGPCRMVKGYMDILEKECDGVKFIEIDADECDEKILEEFSVRGVPTIMTFNDGKMVDMTVGLQTMDQLRQRINNLKQI